MNKSPDRFRRQKSIVVFCILALGMAVALAWVLWEALVQKKGYPEGCLLWLPDGRFRDFTDVLFISTLPNPYADNTSVYPPAAYIFARLLSGSQAIGLISVYFFSLAALALLLVQILRPVVPGAWGRVSLAFFFLALSYPLLFCLDRGNLEIILIPSIGWAVYFFSRHRDCAGAACLFPAICLKAYPALFLIFLLRRGKIGLPALCGLGALAVIATSFLVLQAPLTTMWNSYGQNLEFFRDIYILRNAPLEESASPWNAYKILLLALEKNGFIPLIDFDFDGPFIQASYYAYRAVLLMFALLCTGYAWFYERKMIRGALMLLLLFSISAPSGGDYRLTYASLALAFLMVLPDRRRGDWAALILIALAVIPKKEILFTFAGRTETNLCDVPLQALLNPVLVLEAMLLLLYQSRHPFAWSKLPSRLRQNLFPRRPSGSLA